MKLFCTYCGAANTPDAQICTNCASAIEASGPGYFTAQPAPTPLSQEVSGPPETAFGSGPAGNVPPPATWNPAQFYPSPDLREHVPPPYNPAGASPFPPGAPYGSAPWPGADAQVPRPWPGVMDPNGSGVAQPPYAGGPRPYDPYAPPMRDAYGRPLPPYGQAPVPYRAVTPPAFPAPGAYGQAPMQSQFPAQQPGYSWAAYTSGAYPYAPAPAPPGSLSTALPRFGAYLFDAVMFMVLAMVVLTVTAAVGLGALSLLVLLGLHATYHIGFWATSGRTPGYKAAGLQMIKSDGSKPGLGTASIRYIGWLISPFVLYLNCLWMLWDARKQTWHDKMANTVVIKA